MDEEDLRGLGEVKKLRRTFVSSREKGHVHTVTVAINPDTVIAIFRVRNGHVHVASVPMQTVVDAGGVFESSFDLDHRHTVRIPV